jgi:hypothetical protein
MVKRLVCVAALIVSGPVLAAAQECKVKFAVAYADGKALQVGLTAEQKKFWDREGAKHFKGMCLDAKESNYIILWSEGLSGAESAQAGIDQFNRGRATGQTASMPTNPNPDKSSTTDSRLISGTAYIRPSQEVREKADYLILDTAKTPFAVVRKGQGYQDVPVGRANHPGESTKASDMASTIADPAAAMENALKWLKKEKKL